MASIGIVSRAHGQDAATTDYNSGPAAIGTGPYRLVSWARGDRLVMQRNETYWGKRPAWDTVTFRYVKNSSSRLAALLAGDADLIDTVSVQDIDRLRADKRFTVISGLSADIVWLRVRPARAIRRRKSPATTRTAAGGQTRFAMSARARAAVNLAIDRDAIRDRVMNGQSAPDNQLMQPGQYGLRPRHLPGVSLRVRHEVKLIACRGGLSERVPPRPWIARTIRFRQRRGDPVRRSRRCSPACRHRDDTRR